MSRHLLDALDPELVVWVGWDPPLATFFLQVEPPGGVDGDGLVCWLGTDWGEIDDAAEVVARLSEWAEVPDDLVERLEWDRCTNT